jgi:hypothetical protein
MNLRFPTITTCRLACLFLLTGALLFSGAAAITLTPGSSSSSAVIAQGDPVTISGIATGHPQVGLQIWFIGYNFAKVTTIQVNDDNTYSYQLQSADTADLAPGQYFVVVQHPMENGRFDIVYDSSTGTVENIQTGKTVFQFTGSGSLQSTNSATALLAAIGSQNIDDTFATVTFFVSQPSVGIASPSSVPQGTVFTLNGTTSLAAGDNLKVDITSSSFAPTKKTSSSGFSGASGVIAVQPGISGLNTWSFPVDTSTFAPDEYLVTVSAITQIATASSKFTVVPATTECNDTAGTCPIPGLSSANATAAVTTAAVTGNSTPTMAETTGAPATAAIPATTKSTPLTAAVGLTGTVVAVLLLRRRH